MTPRTLELPTSLKRRLLHLRQLTGTRTVAALDAGQVADVESALRVKLGDPLLALLANRDGALLAHEVRLRNLVGLTKDFHAQGGPRGMIGIGRDPDGKLIFGAPLLGLRLHVVEVETRAVRAMSTEEWLDELISVEIELLRDVESDEKARAFKVLGDAEVTAFAPAVTQSDALRQVQHAKFGLGEILHEMEEGTKLEVRFADGTTRTLLARFVQPVSAEDSSDAD